MCEMELQRYAFHRGALLHWEELAEQTGRTGWLSEGAVLCKKCFDWIDSAFGKENIPECGM